MRAGVAYDHNELENVRQHFQRWSNDRFQNLDLRFVVRCGLSRRENRKEAASIFWWPLHYNHSDAYAQHG